MTPTPIYIELSLSSAIWRKKMKKEVDNYIHFMCNPENHHQCDECPENKECKHSYEAVLPCGQYNCWVDMHTKMSEVIDL